MEIIRVPQAITDARINYIRDWLKHKEAIVFGNEDFPEYVPDYLKKFWRALNTGEFLTEYCGCTNTGLIIDDYFEGDERVFRKFTSVELLRLSESLRHFSDTGSDISLCEVLSIITGGRWEHFYLNGTSPSEWQDFYCDISTLWDEEAVRLFEKAYFDKGYPVLLLGENDTASLEYYPMESEEIEKWFCNCANCTIYQFGEYGGDKPVFVVNFK